VSADQSRGCPLCAKPLIDQSRVEQEIVPSTVPDYWTRTKAAPYRRIVRWTVVKCSKGHRFKRVGDSIYGMDYDL